jgi:hypothetical protein
MVRASTGEAPPKAATGFFGRLQARMEEIQRQADEQAKRQIRNDPNAADGRGGNSPPSPGNREDRRRRKK